MFLKYSQAFIVLPGGFGTMDEFLEAAGASSSRGMLGNCFQRNAASKVFRAEQVNLVFCFNDCYFAQ